MLDRSSAAKDYSTVGARSLRQVGASGLRGRCEHASWSRFKLAAPGRSDLRPDRRDSVTPIGTGCGSEFATCSEGTVHQPASVRSHRPAKHPRTDQRRRPWSDRRRAW